MLGPAPADTKADVPVSLPYQCALLHGENNTSSEDKELAFVLSLCGFATRSVPFGGNLKDKM